MRKSVRGSSLQTVLMISFLMTVLAAAMVGVYTQGLSHTQSFSNGEMAQAEAESAISELLAKLADDELYGTRGEEIRGTRSDLDSSQAYHVLTFSDSSEFPHSTNAANSGGPGSLGRHVPLGYVHAVATGYFRGQYRTVEALIERPPFPYGLASSGSIESQTPLVVKGTSADWVPGSEDRPGHLVSNSPDGVKVGTAPDTETYISGFVKSVGPVEVDQPATVLEGIYPNVQAIDLPVVNFDDFNNQGRPGVVEILDRHFSAQVLDVMYYARNPVEYTGSVEMRNAFIFAENDITIYGGLSGVGAIVCLGNVNVMGGVSLNGTNNVAILSKKKVTLAGQGNHFQGVVYAEEGIEARKITVVGNAIANNPDDPQRAKVELDEVVVISSSKSAEFSFTARSHSRARRQRRGGRLPFRLNFEDGLFPTQEFDVGNDNSSRNEQETIEYLETAIDQLWPEGGRPSDVRWNPNVNQDLRGTALEVLAHYESLISILATARQAQRDLDNLPANASPGERQAAQQRLDQIRTDFNAARETADSSYLDYAQSAASVNGSYLDGWDVQPDITQEYNLDLNTYLPESSHARITFYDVTGRRH